MSRRTMRAGLPCLALSLFSAWGAARALDVSPLLPPRADTAPGPTPAFALDEAAPAAARANPDEILVGRVTSIRFEIAAGMPSGRHASLAEYPAIRPGVFSQVHAINPALLSSGSPLSAAVADALSSPLTWRRLDAVLSAATRAARGAGWSLARAYAPEQDLATGVLRVAVVPVTLEAVETEGAGWSRPGRLERPFAAWLGEIAQVERYGKALSFLDRHPFRRVTPLLTPGQSAGTTRLRLVAEEEKPWRVFAGFETTHSRHSGVGRLTGGFTAVAPWRTEDVLTLQYSADAGFRHMDSVSASYRAALPWGHFLSLTGLWAKSDSSPARLMDFRTTDWLAGLEYAVPLPVLAGWTHEAFAGWEWRRFEGHYLLGGTPIDDGAKADMAPFSLGWRGWRADCLGATSLSLKASWNPGDYLGGRMGRADYERHRLGTGPSFATAAWEVRRDWRLPADFGFLNRAWGQFSDRRLADPARFFLGGNRSVRGYRESELAGDGGWGATLELASPAWRACAPCGDNGPEVRLAAFWDWGQAYRKGPREAWEDKRATGSGAGLGVRAALGKWGSARVDYAWRLRDTGIAEDDRRGYWHVGVSLQF